METFRRYIMTCAIDYRNLTPEIHGLQISSSLEFLSKIVYNSLFMLGPLTNCTIYQPSIRTFPKCRIKAFRI